MPYVQYFTACHRAALEIIPGVSAPVAIITVYFRCDGCGLVFQNPRMDDTAIAEYYTSGAYRKVTNRSIEQSRAIDIEKATATAAIIQTELPGKIASHLDYGCGPGYILDMVEAETQHGIDSRPDDFRANGKAIICPSLEGETKRNFELVTVLHVLEHIPYPLELLKQLHGYMASNGVLVVEVPAKQSALGLPHIYWYNVDVLKKLVTQAGFTVIGHHTTPHTVVVARRE